MITFDAHNFMHMVQRLSRFQHDAEKQDYFTMSDTDKEAYISWVHNAEFLCGMYQLDVKPNIRRLLNVLEGNRNIRTGVPSLVLELRHRISDELTKHRFMYIPDAHATYYEQPNLFGPDVYNKFREARDDVKAAGNCYAAGNWTATVFHLMRVVEFGLRALAKKLKVSLPGPLELEVQASLIRAIEKEILKIEQMPKTRQRERDLEFYHGAASQFRHFKNAWRNHVMHTKAFYDEEDAGIVMRHVDEFMRDIATKLKR